MGKFSQKIVARSYRKRFTVWAICAVLMLAVLSALTAFTWREQITALAAAEDGGDSVSGAERDGEIEHEIKAALRAMPHPGRMAKLAVLLTLVCAAGLWIAFRVNTAEWMYNTAVLHGLTRALWPMLGGVFGILAAAVLLVVINDPKRAMRTAEH